MKIADFGLMAMVSSEGLEDSLHDLTGAPTMSCAKPRALIFNEYRAGRHGGLW